ncbi:MAG: carboxypeptidase regulatory-like domain-containing protein [Acidimicrobiales bacterium]|nr:carboxypeptidase regulatory-like domain-containing protein [Acidimicrobiales bacterium]
MRFRSGLLPVALVLAALAAAAAFGGAAGADSRGSSQPQFFDTLGIAGDGDGELENPRGVAVNRDNGDIYVADTGNDRIVQYDADGRFLRALRNSTVDGLTLDQPWDVALSPSNTGLYVADTGNDRVVVYNTDTALPIRDWGSTGTLNAQFNSPRGITVDSAGDVYVADTGNNRIQKFEPDGIFIERFGSTGSGPWQLRGPRDIAANINDRVFVADTGNDRISVWDSSGHYVSSFGSTGSGNRRFEAPAGIWEGVNLPPTNSMFIADTGNDRISVWRFNDGSNVATWEATFGRTGARNEELEAPRNVFIGDDLRRYVIDSGNDRLALLDPSGPPGVFGRVTNTFGVAVNGIGVIAQDATTFDTVVAAETDRDGNYQLPLPPGDYLLTYFDPDGGHRPEYYPDATDFADAQPVPVQANTVTRADIVLSVNAISPVPVTGTIVGTVEEAAGPAARTWVFAVDANTGTLKRAVQADPAGQFEIGGLATGNYLVVYIDPRGVNATEFFDDHVDPAQADVLAVTSGGPPVQADATLAPPP